MTATIEDFDLEESLNETIPCEVTRNNVPCGHEATWRIRVIHPQPSGTCPVEASCMACDRCKKEIQSWPGTPTCTHCRVELPDIKWIPL